MKRQLPHPLLFLTVLCVSLANAKLAQANPAAAQAANFATSYLLGKGLDAVFDTVSGKPNIRELASRAETVHSMVRAVDANLARRVAYLQSQINDRVTRSEVETLVRQILKGLEDKITELEHRTFTLEERVAAIEELFGIVPYFTPTPLVSDSSDKQAVPQAHPLTKKWILLLVDSEQNRHDLMRLRDVELMAEASQEVQETVKREQQILAASAALHTKCVEEVATELPKRDKLLLKYKPGAPRVHECDRRLASLMWLVAVSRPVQNGPHKGRLAVPRDLLGSKASDILEAIKLSGVDLARVSPLFREAIASDTLSAVGPITSLELSLAQFTSPFKKHVQSSKDTIDACRTLTLRANAENRIIEQLKKKGLTSRHPTLRLHLEEKRKLLKEAQLFNMETENTLATVINAFLEQGRLEHLDSNRMLAFRRRYLASLLQVQEATCCDDWNSSVAQEAVWNRLLDLKDSFTKHWALSGTIKTVDFSPDGSLLVTKNNESISVWNVSSGECVQTLKGYSGHLCTIAFWADGALLTTRPAGNTIEVYCMLSGEHVWTRTLTGHSDAIRSVSLSPDGAWLASTSSDKTFKLWDVSSGECVKTLRTWSRYRRDYRLFGSVLFSPDSSFLAVNKKSDAGGVALLKVPDGDQISTLETGSGFDPVAFSQDGLVLAHSSGSGGHIQLRKVSTGKRLNVPAYYSTSTCTTLSPDGTLLVIGNSRGNVQLYSVSTGKYIRSLDGHSGAVTSASFSPDGSLLVTGGMDGTVRFW